MTTCKCGIDARDCDYHRPECEPVVEFAGRLYEVVSYEFDVGQYLLDLNPIVEIYISGSRVESS